MLSFVEPGQTPEAQKKTLTSAPSTTPTPTASPATPPASQPASAPASHPAPPTDSLVAPTVQAAAESADESANESTEASLPESVADSGRAPALAIEEPTRASATNPVPEPPPQEVQAATRSGALALDQTLIEQWPAWAETLPVTGMAQQLATQSACVAVKDNLVCLKVPTQALSQGSHVKRLTEVLSEHAGQPVRLELQVGELEQGSSAQLIADAASAQRQRQAEQIVSADPFVNALIEGFGAQVIPGSVRAVESSNRSVSS